MENNEIDKRKIKPEGFDIQVVIDSLQGTCKTLDDALESIYQIDWEALTTEDHEQIDSEIFLCETCNWWYAIEDQEDDNVCKDCYEGEVDKLDDEEDYPGEEDEDE